MVEESQGSERRRLGTRGDEAPLKKKTNDRKKGPRNGTKTGSVQSTNVSVAKLDRPRRFEGGISSRQEVSREGPLNEGDDNVAMNDDDNYNMDTPPPIAAGNELRTLPRSARNLRQHEAEEGDGEYPTPQLSSPRPLASEGPISTSISVPGAPRKPSVSVPRLSNAANAAREVELPLRAQLEQDPDEVPHTPAVRVARVDDLQFRRVPVPIGSDNISASIAPALSLDNQMHVGELHVPGGVCTATRRAVNGDEYYYLHTGILSVEELLSTSGKEVIRAVEVEAGDFFTIPHMTKYTFDNKLGQAARLIYFGAYNSLDEHSSRKG